MKMTFDGLLSRTASVFPYRGTNKYPVGNRSNSANYAEMVEVGDDIQFNVCHGWQSTTTEISKAKYDLIKNMKGRSVREDTNTGKCEEYTRTTRPLVVVRSDNTIEFVRGRYWQGDNMKLSEWLRGTIYHSYRVSGTAMHVWQSSGVTHFPVFEGLRVNAETFEPHNQNIQIFRRMINRKKSKELMGKYRGAFKSVHTMMKCMDSETLMVSVKDIYDEYAEREPNGGQAYIGTGAAFKIGEKLFDEGLYFDAAVMLSIGCDVRCMSSWYISNYTTGQRYNRISPSTVVPNMLNLLSKSVYKTHKPFHEEEVPFGKITGSEWGLRIVVDGKEIES